MAAKDRYAFPVRCDACATYGQVHVCEDDHPFMGSLNASVTKVEEEFKAISNGNKILVTCRKCGNEATK